MALLNLDHPWLSVFGILGNIVSILVFLAPVPVFRRIYKEKCTMGYQSVPYVVALFSSMLWMYYAFIKKDALLLVSINSFGCVIETIYISIFLLYASKEAKKQTVKLLVSLIGGLYTLIFLVTLFPLSGQLRVTVVGWICVAVATCVFAAPLSIVYQVVRTKSVEFMPFTLSFFLTLSAIMWFGYGVMLKDLCVALPNVFGFFLGMIQMLLYGLYRNAKPTEKLEKMAPEHVINIVELRNTDQQIHPVNSASSEDIIKNLDVEETRDNHVISSEPPVLPVANDDEERANSGNLAEVNLHHHQAPVVVVCAAA